MRHGKDRCHDLPNSNNASWVSDEFLEKIASVGVKIRIRFSCTPNIYVSDADRAIETAILVADNGLANLARIRKIIGEKLLEEDVKKQGGNWYRRFAIDLLPQNIYVVKELYDRLPINVLADDNFIAVTHFDVIRDFGFELNYACYIESI